MPIASGSGPARRRPGCRSRGAAARRGPGAAAPRRRRGERSASGRGAARARWSRRCPGGWPATPPRDRPGPGCGGCEPDRATPGPGRSRRGGCPRGVARTTAGRVVSTRSRTSRPAASRARRRRRRRRPGEEAGGELIVGDHAVAHREAQDVEVAGGEPETARGRGGRGAVHAAAIMTVAGRVGWASRSDRATAAGRESRPQTSRAPPWRRRARATSSRVRPSVKTSSTTSRRRPAVRAGSGTRRTGRSRSAARRRRSAWPRPARRGVGPVLTMAGTSPRSKGGPSPGAVRRAASLSISRTWSKSRPPAPTNVGLATTRSNAPSSRCRWAR